MAFYLQIDLEEPEQVATNTGWGEVLDWSERLDPGAFPNFVHLCEHGWASGAALADELARAMQAAPPRSADLRRSLTGLLHLFQAAKSAEVVSLTDGLG